MEREIYDKLNRQRIQEEAKKCGYINLQSFNGSDFKILRSWFDNDAKWFAMYENCRIVNALNEAWKVEKNDNIIEFKRINQSFDIYDKIEINESEIIIFYEK